MKCITSLVTTGVAVGLTTFAPGVLAQSAPGVQPADPSTQPAPSQQSRPGEEPSTEPSSSNGPSATSVAPTESPAAAAGESPSASTTGSDARSVPDARSSMTMAGPATEAKTRLAAVTPPGMSTEEACMGFKSISACAAAMHAAQNVSVPFGDLKSKLTSGQKLDAAIHALKPGVNAPEEASRAENQARSDVTAPQG
jgi:hypothetical protein